MLTLNEAEFMAMPLSLDDTVLWVENFGCLVANFASCVFGVKDRETISASYRELVAGAHGKRLGWLLDTWENAYMFMPYDSPGATAWEMCRFPKPSGKVGSITRPEWNDYIKVEFIQALKESKLVAVV